MNLIYKVDKIHYRKFIPYKMIRFFYLKKYLLSTINKNKSTNHNNTNNILRVPLLRSETKYVIFQINCIFYTSLFF